MFSRYLLSSIKKQENGRLTKMKIHIYLIDRINRFTNLIMNQYLVLLNLLPLLIL